MAIGLPCGDRAKRAVRPFVAPSRRERPARPRVEGGPVKLDTIQDVFVGQLGDLRSAEEQLVEALPKLAAAATDPELRQAFEEHLEETRGHARRLEDAI